MICSVSVNGLFNLHFYAPRIEWSGSYIFCPFCLFVCLSVCLSVCLLSLVGWLYWGFTSLQRYFNHIATWKQKITNLCNSSGEAGNRTRTSCSASQELNHSATAAPICLLSTITFAITFEPLEVETSYLACILHQWCPFKWHEGQWPCDLDFDLCAKSSLFWTLLLLGE